MRRVGALWGNHFTDFSIHSTIIGSKARSHGGSKPFLLFVVAPASADVLQVGGKMFPEAQ